MPSDRHDAPEGDDWRRQHEQRQERLVAETPALIADIAARVAALPPGQLLARAYFEHFALLRDVRDETDIGHDQIIAIRMIDYSQSVIASVPPAADQKKELSNADWEALRDAVGRLFTTHIDAFAAANMDSKEEHGRSFLQSSLVRYWYSVSGKRFPYHFRRHLSDLLLKQSPSLEEALGVTAADLIDALVAIEEALVFGPEITRRDLFEAGLNLTQDGVIHDPELIGTLGDIPAGLNRAANDLNWPTTTEDILDRAAALGIFDVQRSADLPEAVMRSLSWEPGENQDFFAAGEMAGSPLRSWPIFERPFLRLDGRYYCFAPLRLIDHAYAAVERLVLQSRPDEKNRWLETRAQQMERVVAMYFSRILPDAHVLTNVHYSAHGLTGEVDVLVLYDDHMLVIEVKAGDYTDLPPATDFEEHLRSVQKLGVASGKQVQRFLDCLQATESLPIYDSNNKKTRQKLADLGLADFRQISLCAVTLEPFTEFAAQLHHLEEFGIDPGEQPTWVISLDDLHVYADVFDNPLIFLHYIEQRLIASRADRLALDDELYHLGMYLTHNDYVMYANEQMDQGEFTDVLWLGYHAPIDQAFAQRLLEPTSTLALRQEMPERLSEAIDALARSDRPGRARVASYLLTRSGIDRTRVADAIEEELARQPIEQKPHPMAAYDSEEPMVLFCWSPHTGGRNPAAALLHAQVLVAMHQEDRRLLLELTYSETGKLRAVDWTWLTYAGLPKDKLPDLEERALEMQRSRKARALDVRRQARLSDRGATPRRIGRNEPCVCGSGKKYKRCCMKLQI